MSFGTAAQRAGQRIVRLSRAARSQSKTPKVDAHKASHFKAMQNPPLHPKIGLVANKKEACVRLPISNRDDKGSFSEHGLL